MKTFTLNISHATKSFTKYQDFFTTQVTSSVFGAAQLILEEYIDGRWERVTGSQVITGDTPEFITKINGARLRYRLSDSDNSTSVTLQSAQVTSDDGYAYQISEGGGDGAVGPQGPQGEPGADSTVAGPAGEDGQPGADGADGADNATLASVTSNGATTTNNITVGSKFATGSNVASGGNAIAIGGTGNTASGDGSEVLGGDGSTASGQGSSVIGGSNHQNAANWTATVGGLNQTVASGAPRGAILAGFGHNLNHSDSAIIGGSNITSDANNTVFVPNLNVKDGFKMPTGASDGDVLTTDANGVGTWQPASGGGGGGNVVASYVDTSFVMSKTFQSNQIFNVTGLSYAMEAGKTYYFKMYHWNDRPSSIFSTSTYCNLSFTPWGATAGVRETCQGMQGDENILNRVYSNALAPWDDYATKRNCNLGGYGYHGWSKLEGQFVAPTSATFTPTITIFGSSTGNLTVSFQGAIWQMD